MISKSKLPAIICLLPWYLVNAPPPVRLFLLLLASPSSAYASERQCAATTAVDSALGMPRERFVLEGYGESRPIAPNDRPETRALNRRVEIRGEVEEQERAAVAPPCAATLSSESAGGGSRQPPVGSSTSSASTASHARCLSLDAYAATPDTSAHALAWTYWTASSRIGVK